MKSVAILLALALLAAPAAAEVLKPWAGGATPALELADLQGTKHTLAGYRGKVVLVNFWATWCEPCREEMPSIERLRASLEGRPFVVLAVNLAEPESRIRKFLAAVPVGFPVLLDRDTQTSRAWQAKVLPATYIVGPEGRIRYRHVGELDWSRPEVRETILGLIK
ncbi:MAG TPA: TlpA disulfide reductase family protein [Burkholderiales bacterium]|nr:TlpA disulfide reductase family protein [Burkholderiales bacterium]